MSGIQKLKRITFKHTRPNPLFHSWLLDLYNDAKETDSKLQDMLKEALSSLSKYPLPLKSGSECAILKGFGKKLCLFLDKKLQVYKENISQECQTSSDGNTSVAEESQDSCKDDVEMEDVVLVQSKQPATHEKPLPRKKKSPKKPRIYKPAHRSGGYAILVALLKHSEENPDTPMLKKEDLMRKAQPFCEESFFRPKPNTFYTAWSNIKTLILKGLVSKTRTRNAEFILTDEGSLIAKEVFEDSNNIPTANDIIFNGASVSQHNKEVSVIPTPESSQSSQTDIQTNGNVSAEMAVNMSVGSYDVILLIDKQEISGASNKNDPTVAQFKKYPYLKHEYRHLKVGDFTWIARSKTTKDLELVLPFIVERKRMDDLGHSIKDGRFHEQKFRLRKCGLKNVIYLVENYGSNKHVGLPYQSLMQALANTRVQDEFKVHITDSLTNSARFLAMMTKRLTVEYKDKRLRGLNGECKGEELMTFSYFNKSSAKTKTMTVTETFIKLLLQLKGMSVEKALAITDVFKTPKDLIETYKVCSVKEGEMLLANLKHGDLSRSVGPAVSKAIYHLLAIN